jgi:hypothetical protein
VRDDAAAAAVGWAYISVGWFLPAALADDPPSRVPGRRMPKRRAMIQHRLGEARRCAELPALADLAARLHDALDRRWGPHTLDHAPAFRRPPDIVRSTDA